MSTIVEASPFTTSEVSRMAPWFTPVIFNTMRILKRVNPGDTYLENYQWHHGKRGLEFVDQYHLAWIYGAIKQPKTILEIGTRTGISLAQILSSLLDYKGLFCVTFDLFSDEYCTEKLVERNLRALNIPCDTVEFVQGDSKDTVPQFLGRYPKQRFEYVLVDGDHSNEGARRDLENVAPVVAPGGMLVFDDIGEDGVNLIPVWLAFQKDHIGEFDFHTDLNGKGTGWGLKR